MNVSERWRAIADGRQTGLFAGVVKFVLAPVAVLYGLLLTIRTMLYHNGLLTVKRLPCPVISIGNITVGGTGKTPVTALVARNLQARGLRVAVLSRGYGGNLEGQVAVVSDGQKVTLQPEQCGDEPYLLATTVPGLMVVIGADRYQAGLLAIEQLKPDIMLLDDGFQHMRLHRDLNILLLDATRPFGNGWSLPAGLMRECRTAYTRADLVLFTRCHGSESLPELSVPVSRSSHRLTSFHLLQDGTGISIEHLCKVRIAVFAGIADPTAFFDGLRQLGINPVATLNLPDHEPYHGFGIQKVNELFERSAPDFLVTTEKDGVKLKGGMDAWRKRLVTARLEVQLEDDELLQQSLDKLLLSRP